MFCWFFGRLILFFYFSRSSRPASLDLEQQQQQQQQQVAGDNSSEVTGQTSGYSTSNDSDLEEARELDFDDDDLPLSRDMQVKPWCQHYPVYIYQCILRKGKKIKKYSIRESVSARF